MCILVCAAIIMRCFLEFSYTYIIHFLKTLGILFKISPYFQKPRCIFFLYLHSFLFYIKFSLKTLEISFQNSLDPSKYFRICVYPLFIKSLSISPAFYLNSLHSSLPQYHSNGVRFPRCCLSPGSCLLSNKGWTPRSSGYPVSFLLPSVVLFLVLHLLAYVPRPPG